MKYLLLGLILTGCGPTDNVWMFDCLRLKPPIDLIADGAVFDMDRINSDVELAKSLIDSRYGIGTFCARAGEVTVRVRPGIWNCISPVGLCVGEYNSISQVVDTIKGNALVHEFIHVQEAYKFELGTMWHEGWDKNGQYELSDEYDNFYLPWW